MTIPTASGSGRETRLLFLIIVVAVVGLLALARFRFPASDRVAVAPSPGPIGRIAARATFDDLSLIMADVSARVESSMVSVTLERVPPAIAKPSRGTAAAAPGLTPELRVVAGLRITADLALIHLPNGFQVRPGDGVEAGGVDEARQLAVVRVPATTDAVIGLASPGAAPVVAGYLALVEGGRVGPSVRPVFIGRFDPVNDDKWTEPPLALGGESQVPPGGFAFTLDGHLIGMTMIDSFGSFIVGAAALESAVAAMLGAPKG